MPDMQRHLDLGSKLVILVTFVLFAIALFVKGFSHEILLEAGVFLVSVKLILMAYANSVAAKNLTGRLDALEHTLGRLADRLESPRPVDSDRRSDTPTR